MKFKRCILAFYFSCSSAFAVTVCGNLATENQTSTTTCASGQTISKVVFASYGSPTGTCGAYTASTCNAATSKSVVETACLNKTSCSVAATNNVFGDPCSGVGKKLLVQVECTFPLVTKATPTAAAPSVLPVPAGIKSGQTVLLNCGQIYQGTLNLNNLSNVIVKTNGTCAATNKPTITPGRLLNGWTAVAGKSNIFSTPVPSGFVPDQIIFKGQHMSKAHWPNAGWAKSSSPSNDVIGASKITLANQSVVSEPEVLTSTAFSTTPGYYLEGKYWMLDAANEWAISGTKIYVWSTDLASLTNNVWASAKVNAINADSSVSVSIDGIKVTGANHCISADMSKVLTVTNTDISSCEQDGIWASGSTSLTVSKSTVTNARRNGIDGWYSVKGAKILNTTVTNTGMVGMPSNTQAAIMFGNGESNTIDSA